MTARNNGKKTRGKPFEPGNPGRPKGARHKITRAIEELLDGEAESITRKCIELAQAGDMTAIRLCMERLAPVRKGRPITFELPKIETAGDVVGAFDVVFKGIAEGDVTPDEAAILASVLEAKRRAVETSELEKRIAAIEGRVARA